MIPKGEFSELIAAKVSPAHREKLQALAKQSHRTLSEVVRLLIEQAEASPHPDIALVGAVGEADA